MEDRTSCILFGDGAGAAVLRPHEECGQGEILRSKLGSDGSGFEFIHIPHGGTKYPHDHPDYEPGKHYITLKGREQQPLIGLFSRLFQQTLQLVQQREA